MVIESNQTLLARKDKRLPLAVPVQRNDHHCLAFRDKEENWVDFHSGKPLIGKIRIVESEFSGS